MEVRILKDKTVHYLCFYTDADTKDTLVSFPSVWSKIDYVRQTLSDIGYRVQVVSSAFIRKKGRYHRRTVQIGERSFLTYFHSFKTGNRFLDRLNTLYIYLQIIHYFLHIPREDAVLVYHSLYYMKPLYFLRKVLKRHFFLEIEDVYSSLGDSTKQYSAKEWRFFRQADGFLCVNDLLAEQLPKDKPRILSYGRYALPPLYPLSKTDDHRVHLIYAGVIERERQAAFLAVHAVKYLSADYVLHICGFGDEDEVAALQQDIQTINAELGRPAVYFHGMLNGQPYESLLQSCHIALSTHRYTPEHMSSANHTFPSKILVYLANNLRVVAQGIPCLQRASFHDWIQYYTDPTPQAVAAAITHVDITRPYDSRSLIAALDKTFHEDLKMLLK